MESGKSAGPPRALAKASSSHPSGTKLRSSRPRSGHCRTKGFAGASARAIAPRASFNQALIFYHFGSVRNPLLAVLDLISERR